MWVIYFLCGLSWFKYGRDLRNTHFQVGKGKMEREPVVKWEYETGGWVETFGAVVEDLVLDGSGVREVVIPTLRNWVYCIRYNGVVEWIHTITPISGELYSTPVIEDVDSDGFKEVVFGGGNAYVYCLNEGGGVEWRFEAGGSVFSGVTAADINKDGEVEVMFGCRDFNLYILKGSDGSLIDTIYLGCELFFPPSICDINGDNNLDIVTGWSRGVEVIDGVTLDTVWRRDVGTDINCPVVEDIDGDGGWEIVFGTRTGYLYVLRGNSDIYWSAYIGDVFHPPAVGDLDGDGKKEIVLGPRNTSGLYCYNYSGGRRWAIVPHYSKVHRSPVLADIDGDGDIEILVSNNDGDTLICINKDGTIQWRKKLYTDIHDPVVADIDNDGCLEIVVGTMEGGKVIALDDQENGTCESTGIEEEEGKRRIKVDINFTSFYLEETGVYSFTIYNLVGRKVCGGELVVKEGRKRVNIRELRRGVYFIQLKNKGKTIRKKLVILR